MLKFNTLNLRKDEKHCNTKQEEDREEIGGSSCHFRRGKSKYEHDFWLA